MDAKSWSLIAAEHAVHRLVLEQLVRQEDIPRAVEVVRDTFHYRLCLDDESHPAVSQAERDDTALAREIEQTLKSFTFVSRLSDCFPVSKREFWQRCRLLTTNWRHLEPPRIFVDGLVGACKWNSWKVYSEAREAGLSLWSGYAYAGVQWTAHTWCMLGEKFVETGAPFRIYFGAELDASELEILRAECADVAVTVPRIKLVWSMVNGQRDTVRYDEAEHTHSIGRERDPLTGAIKEGLGR